MREEILRPGMYVLTADVVNHKADRRRNPRYDLNQWPVWKKGTRLLYSRYEGECGSLTHQGTYGKISDFRTIEHDDTKRFQAIAAVAEPVEPTDAEWCWINNVCHETILLKLMMRGMVSREAILQIQKEKD